MVGKGFIMEKGGRNAGVGLKTGAVWGGGGGGGGLVDFVVILGGG